VLLRSYFDKFVSNIEPSEERVAAVSEAHRVLREHLISDASLAYPVDDSFLAGSYARHTATAPIKDVDIILALQRKEVSQDGRTPEPGVVLQDLKKAIDQFYDDVSLVTQRRSIRVNLVDDDIMMDVVPSIAPTGKDQLLYVPDRDQALWLPSNPAAHSTRTTALNGTTEGQFVRVAKALKWWKGRLPKDQAPKSFLLETIAAQNAKKADSVVEAFVATLDGILSSYRTYRDGRRLPTIADPGVPENDLVVSCGWPLDGFLFFYDEVVKLHGIARRATDEDTKKEKTIELWQSVFGDVYPSSLSDEEEKAAKRVDAKAPPTYRPQYPHRARISARLALSKNGPANETYPSNGRKLPKNMWLQFRLDENSVPEPYQIRWAVRNHGAEARADQGLSHETCPGGHTQWESTKYRGHHYMDCEILKDGTVVAKARHVVNIF
jgi:Adenylyl/Guanylyl and SMODS C-terminal sensor domain/Second Messenger Oligonucleotide or Dinucleotide Synthetase domain